MLQIQLVVEQVVHAVHQRLLLLDHGVRDLLECEKHHIVALGEERVHELEELGLNLLCELWSNQVVVSAKYLEKDNIVELVEDEEAKQVLMLRDVAQQADDKVEKAIHLEVALIASNLQVHDQILHEVDYLGEALEILKGWVRVLLIPVNLRIAIVEQSLRKHAKV